MISEQEQKVYDILSKLKIQYHKMEHEAVFTVEQAQKYDKNIPGTHCKNLFVRNRKGDKHYLIVLTDFKKVDLKKLAKNIGSTNLSFASEERLYKYLGVKPGSVTPFGLINDIGKEVDVLLDKDFMDCNKISFHPNVNTATITIDYKDFEKFLKWNGNKVHYVQI